MIDVELCEDLCLNVNPFTHDISHYEGVEGVKMVGSALSILGWVEVELSIPHMGSIQAKFWITECMYDRATPIVLGSHQVKMIFAQANLDRIDLWPKPWKTVYEWCSLSEWYECIPKTYGSDSFEEENPLPEADLAQLTKKVDGSIWSLSDSWSDSMGIVELHCDENIDEVEFVENLKLTEKVIHGITDSGLESEGEACSAPPAKIGPPPKEEAKPQGGGAQSVFNSLTAESENSAEEVSNPTCNKKDPANTESLTVRLCPFPTVSCRITPTGETILSFQWETNK